MYVLVSRRPLAVHVLGLRHLHRHHMQIGVPYAALWTASVPTWTADACPQCAAGTPAVVAVSVIGLGRSGRGASGDAESGAGQSQDDS